MRRFTIGLVILMLALGACTPNSTAQLPTIAVIPSSTITLTPSVTLTRTATNTSTATQTPSNTATDTPTITLTPSITLTPTNTSTTTLTPTDTPLPTNTPTETFTPSNTPLATATPLPTETPVPPTATVAPTIKSLTASPANVQAGGQVVIQWDADADKAILDELTPGNALIATFNVAASGSQTFVMTTDNGNTVNFRLTVTKGGKNALATTTVTISCASPWIVTPTPTGCPQAAQVGAFTTQSFQQGIAFYIPNTNQVFFLASNGAAVNVFTNTWNSSIVIPTSVPPSGFTDPTGPIGYIWHNFPWSDGRNLQTVVGWGAGPSQNYNGTMQVGSSSNIIYIKGPTGATYRLTMSGNVGTWALVS